MGAIAVVQIARTKDVALPTKGRKDIVADRGAAALACTGASCLKLVDAGSDTDVSSAFACDARESFFLRRFDDTGGFGVLAKTVSFELCLATVLLFVLEALSTARKLPRLDFPFDVNDDTAFEQAFDLTPV